MNDSWYDRYLVPPLMDFACGLPVVAAQRRAVVPLAAGRVLEVGIGTGRNLRFYDTRRIESLVGVDPGERMHPQAARRAARAGLPLELLASGAEQLPLPDGSFDCVVCTFTLCSVQDPLASLGEMRRVLRPGGQLLFSEHGLAPEARVARWQRRLEPLWMRLAGGCHLTRDLPALLREAGFRSDLLQGYFARPHTVGYGYWGQASAA